MVWLGFVPYSVTQSIYQYKLQNRNFGDVSISVIRNSIINSVYSQWLFNMFGFFTAITKFSRCILPLIPVTILLILFYGSFLNKHISPGISLQITTWGNLLFVTTITIASFHTTKTMLSDPAVPEFRITLQEYDLITIDST